MACIESHVHLGKKIRNLLVVINNIVSFQKLMGPAVLVHKIFR